MPTTPAQTVKKARKHYAAARTMQRNVRLRRYNGRNSDATERGIDWRYRQAQRETVRLSKRLQGLLWEEHHLALRISEANDEGQERPELRDRIRVLRNTIRTEIAAASNGSQVIR